MHQTLTPIRQNTPHLYLQPDQPWPVEFPTEPGILECGTNGTIGMIDC